MLSLESQRVFQILLFSMTGPLGNSDFVSLGKQNLLFPSEQKIQYNANADTRMLCPRFHVLRINKKQKKRHFFPLPKLPLSPWTHRNYEHRLSWSNGLQISPLQAPCNGRSQSEFWFDEFLLLHEPDQSLQA